MPETTLTQNVALVIAAAFAVLGTHHPVRASEVWRDVYRCEGSTGHSFFMSGTGWTPDGISEGQVALRKRGKDFDIQISDATGSSFSTREDGAEIFAREESGVIQVVAIYPMMTVETFMFAAPKQGRTTLAWTSSKRTGIEDRVSAFASQCKTR